MIKINRKQKCNSPKVKVPKIEINECKMKTKDQKKLENEMFKQAKDAQILLEKLLLQGESDEEYREGRTRSNSLNATMENLLLTRHKAELNMKPRGSVPNIANISRRFFCKGSRENSPRQPSSPVSSPDTVRSTRSIMNPMKYIRKHAEADINTSDVKSPKYKKKIADSVEENASCTSFKPVGSDDIIRMDENEQAWKEKLI